jgi:hypothetical protein
MSKLSAVEAANYFVDMLKYGYTNVLLDLNKLSMGVREQTRSVFHNEYIPGSSIATMYLISPHEVANSNLDIWKGDVYD